MLSDFAQMQWPAQSIDERRDCLHLGHAFFHHDNIQFKITGDLGMKNYRW